MIMKSLNYWILLWMMAASCLMFTSCGDDDDENGKVKECYVDADGRNIGFQHAYLSIDEPSTSGGLYEYGLEFSNVDYISIAKNPTSIIGKKISDFYISFRSPNKYDINSLPEGEFPYARYSSGNEEYYDDCEIGINGVIDSNGDESCEQYYESDWNSGYNSGNLIISKTSEGLYKIEIKDLKLLAAEPGDFDLNNSKRKTTGSFYFEGRFEDISDYDFDF